MIDIQVVLVAICLLVVAFLAALVALLFGSFRKISKSSSDFIIDYSLTVEDIDYLRPILLKISS